MMSFAVNNANNLNDVSAFIKAEVRTMGFDLVGIMPASYLQEEAEKLQQWLGNQYHAGMDWMTRYTSIRSNPTEILPDCQTVVMVGINYFPGWEAGQGKDAKIARYALGKDYHKLIRRRLAKLLKIIQQRIPTAQGRAFADSAPLLEKALAVRAGLGWQGKHGLLINPTLGSWIFLGELLLTIPLAYDEPLPVNSLAETISLCGNCTRCITACPTQAITAPTVVDANRCIAYWTIEAPLEAALPESLSAELFQQWVFGCDICQEVCPWNIKFAQLTSEHHFLPQPLLETPENKTLQQLSSEQFEQVFAGSAVRRAGFVKFQQNLARVYNTTKTIL
jgi:epoxyqueuosine reductase